MKDAHEGSVHRGCGGYPLGLGSPPHLIWDEGHFCGRVRVLEGKCGVRVHGAALLVNCRQRGGWGRRPPQAAMARKFVPPAWRVCPRLRRVRRPELGWGARTQHKP